MISPLAQAKERLTIMEAWRLCNLPGQPVIGKNRSPFRKDSNPSFSIFAEGKRWKDFGTGESGSVVDFVAKAHGIGTREACQTVIRLAGLEPTSSVSTVPPAVRPPDPEPPAWSTVEAEWLEAVAWIAGNQEMRERLAKWRGWPVHWVDSLVEAGHLGFPEYQGKRQPAFLVLKPVADGGEKVGWHQRIKTPDNGKEWRFNPKRIKAYPFWLGCLRSPRLIITEGQWDAITLAGSAGWLDRHEAWPEDLAVIGIRGSTGHKAFLETVAGTLKETRPEILVLRDADEAGDAWRIRFAPELKELAGSVRLFRMEGAKDLNEAHKNKPLTPEDVWAILGGKNK